MSYTATQDLINSLLQLILKEKTFWQISFYFTPSGAMMQGNYGQDFLFRK
jgi:hypothetical protein